MAEVFGFDEAGMDIETLLNNAESISTVYEQSATKLQDRTKSIASSKGLQVTGAGVSGIEKEVDGNGFKIGWGPRPNFHLYFHEIGTYKDPPRPHIRPATDELKDEIYDDTQKHIEKGV